MGWYVKNGERSQKWGGVGNVWNAKSCFANARVKREFINKKYKKYQQFTNFEKNLSINIIEGPIFS